LVMNVKNDFGQRVAHVIRKAGKIIAQFTIRGSVQPIIDYHRIMAKPDTIDIPATAGNVSYTISPGTGKMFEILYGCISMITDGTAANRKINSHILDADANRLSGGMEGAAQAASLTRNHGLSSGPINGDVSDLGGDGPEGSMVSWTYVEKNVYESDYLKLYWTSGQAGDSYSGKLKIIEHDIARES
jgi:hypothetical protein